MIAARVSIVVATWNRPDALRAAVQSALRQTVADWRMLVIGDGCDGRTGALLAEFADARIAYVNLPERFGEQSGPNSIGMALAEAPAIALLNHDDVWLEDHLERSLAALDGPAELSIGRSARASHAEETPEGPAPVFTRQSPARRRLTDAFHDIDRQFEPCSTWAFRTELARRVGPWRAARALYRTPAEDWLLRAWRLGPRVHFEPVITVLHLTTHHYRAHEQGSYAAASPEHATLTALLARTPVAELRAGIEAEASTRRRSLFLLGLRRPLRGALLNPLTAGLYRRTGLDAHTLYSRLRRKPRGDVLARAALRRSGRRLPPPPDRELLISEARRLLAGTGA